nr:PREDICTED: uncharacterized protein LOC107075929 [Lepisosteus oculatus]
MQCSCKDTKGQYCSTQVQSHSRLKVQRKMELVLFTCLLFLWPVAGTESEQVIDRYGLKGKPYLLDVEGVKPAENRKFYWRFNTSKTILEYTFKIDYLDIFPHYESKVMFFKTNFLLQINKLEESDNGFYTAIIQDKEGTDKSIVTYRLIPQDSVIKPELKVKSASASEERCNISATCTVGQDNSVSYNCQQTHCTEVRRDYIESDALEIVVTVENSSIVCKASNRVSKESHWLALKDVCRNSEPHNAAVIIGVASGISVVVTFFVLSIIYMEI